MPCPCPVVEACPGGQAGFSVGARNYTEAAMLQRTRILTFSHFHICIFSHSSCFFPVAILILLSTAAGAWIIPADLGPDLYRFLLYGRAAGRIEIIFFIGGIIFSCCFYLFLVCPHLAHVGLLRTRFLQWRLLFLRGQ